MAVNRFDQPIDSQFINTYVPIPFEQMLQAGAMKQQRYDTAASALDESIARAESINAIPNSVDARNRDLALTKMYDIRDKYVGQDLSNPMVYRQLNNEIRSAVKPADIRKWEDSYSGWQNYNKMAMQMQARGEQIYNPFRFEGYDSSNTGIFTGLPTMDLGEKAEAKISQFLSKPELKWREVNLPSGRVGTEHYRDINEIGHLIDTEAGDLVNDPAIRQLMEREGFTEESFKEYLRNRAPSFIKRQLTSASFYPGAGNKSTSLRPFVGRTNLPAEVVNQTGQDVRRSMSQKRDELDLQKSSLQSMIESGADAGEIKLKQDAISNLEESLLQEEGMYNKVVKNVDALLEDENRNIKQKYFNELMKLPDMTERRAENLMNMAADISGTEDISMAAMGQEGVVMNRLIREATDVSRPEARWLTGYALDLKPYTDKRNSMIDEGIYEAMSSYTTTDAVTFRQTKDTNGYMQYAGMDNKMYDSFIHAGVTIPMMDNPGAFKLQAADYRLNNKKDLDKYVSLAKKEDSGYSLELTSTRATPNPEGGVDVYYKLSGPKIPGDDKSTIVTASINKPEQIQNIMADLIMQGDMEAASTYTYGAFMPMAIREGAGEYQIQVPNVTGEGSPVLQANVNVSYNKDSNVYEIRVGDGSDVIGTAQNREQLGMALIELQTWAMANPEQFN